MALALAKGVLSTSRTSTGVLGREVFNLIVNLDIFFYFWSVHSFL